MIFHVCTPGMKVYMVQKRQLVLISSLNYIWDLDCFFTKLANIVIFQIYSLRLIKNHDGLTNEKYLHIFDRGVCHKTFLHSSNIIYYTDPLSGEATKIKIIKNSKGFNNIRFSPSSRRCTIDFALFSST